MPPGSGGEQGRQASSPGLTARKVILKGLKANESPAPVKYGFAGDNPNNAAYTDGPAHGVSWVTITK